MAWNARGEWIPDEQKPVALQQQQLTGLLATTALTNPGIRTMGRRVAPAPAPTGSGPIMAPEELARATGQDPRLVDRDARTAERDARRDDRRGGKDKPPRNGGGGTPTPTPTPGTTPTPTPTPGSGLTTSPQSGAPPTMADSSVATQLTGLLSSNSPYMQAAREAGLRVANRRGLLNSSVAAGASEASAIAAAAPIASQDAAQIHARNQTNLEGWTQLRNASVLQTMQDAGAMDRLTKELQNRLQLQSASDASAMARLIAQGDIEKAISTMNNSAGLTQTQINANVSLLSNYMQSFATLSQNPELPAAARDAYMAEFMRVTSMGQNLVNSLAGTTVTWPTTTPGTPTPAPTPTTTPHPPTGTGTGTTSGGGTIARSPLLSSKLADVA